MTYTFDDAIKHWNRESANGPLVPGIVASPFRNVPQQEYDRVKFMNRLFYSIIEQLREEYAPTVEMTKHQKFVFMRLHENKKPVFVDIDTVYNTPEFASIDTDLLILAWFHPEIIKVVDE